MGEKQELNKKQATKFTKEKLLTSQKYSNRKDAVNAVLDNDKEYSFEEVDTKINEFMKGKVN